MAAFKPTFTISDKQILWNLHVASIAKLLKSYPRAVDLADSNNKLDQTALRSTVGYQLCGMQNAAIGKDAKDSFKSNDSIYEASVMYKFYVSLTSTSSKTSAQPDVKAVEDAKKEAAKVLQQYFTVFCGSDLAKKINVSSLQEGRLDEKGFKAFSVTYSVGAKA